MHAAARGATSQARAIFGKRSLTPEQLSQDRMTTADLQKDHSSSRAALTLH